MELKCNSYLIITDQELAHNRTIVELKLEKWPKKRVVAEPLIEPFAYLRHIIRLLPGEIIKH